MFFIISSQHLLYFKCRFKLKVKPKPFERRNRNDIWLLQRRGASKSSDRHRSSRAWMQDLDQGDLNHWQVFR